MQLTVLVAGGAGFIGSHLCDRLLADGCQVDVVDNFSTGSAANLEHLRNRPDCRIVCRSVCDISEFPGEYDLVFNLASPASPKDYLAAPIETLMAGSVGTRNLLEIARRSQATFVQVSTSETYGDPQVHPQPETYWGNVNPVGPRAVYDESKRFSEALTMAFHRKYGMKTRITRLFNTYGPRMKSGDGRVLPAFLEQARSGQPLTVFGNGTQTRCFCYVSDIVDGLVRLAGSDEPTPVNLGSTSEVTVLDLARIVEGLVGHPCAIQWLPLPEDDPQRRCPDISKAVRLLGWEPCVPLDEGLRRMLEPLRKRS